jgi:hypothetical protein
MMSESKTTFTTFDVGGDGTLTRYPKNVETLAVRADAPHDAVVLTHSWNGDARQIRLSPADARRVAGLLTAAAEEAG